MVTGVAKKLTFGDDVKKYEVENLRRVERKKAGPSGSYDVAGDAGPYKFYIVNEKGNRKVRVDWKSSRGFLERMEFSHTAIYKEKEDGFVFFFGDVKSKADFSERVEMKDEGGGERVKMGLDGQLYFPKLFSKKEIEGLNKAKAHIAETGPTLEQVENISKIVGTRIRRDAIDEGGKNYGIKLARFQKIEATLKEISLCRKQIERAARLSDDKEKLLNDQKVKELLGDAGENAKQPGEFKNVKPLGGSAS